MSVIVVCLIDLRLHILYNYLAIMFEYLEYVRHFCRVC